MTAPSGYTQLFKETFSKTVAEGHFFDSANYGSTWTQYGSSSDGTQGSWVRDSLVSVQTAGVLQLRCYVDASGNGFSPSPLQRIFPGQTGFASGRTYYRWQFDMRVAAPIKGFHLS